MTGKGFALVSAVTVQTQMEAPSAHVTPRTNQPRTRMTVMAEVMMIPIVSMYQENAKKLRNIRQMHL